MQGVRQAIWPTGEPTTEPMPDRLPEGQVEIKDRSGFGSTFDYAVEKTHKHFHLSSAARYELRPEDGAPRVSDKVGLLHDGAQREFQWVDITGVEPGPAVLRGQANPLHCVLESDETNNTTDDARTIPGVRARESRTTFRPGESAVVALGGELVAPEIPARRAGNCGSGFCYVRASA